MAETHARATTRDQERKRGGRSIGGAEARRRLLANMPVTERRPQLAGMSTAVLEGGDGPPVVLLPTTLIWGRHDSATPLTVAEAASARFDWPLHVIESCNDDPPVEQPEALLRALNAALGGVARPR
jgi:pimeloyl-ACP methyl ester carboxylesterase